MKSWAIAPGEDCRGFKLFGLDEFLFPYFLSYRRGVYSDARHAPRPGMILLDLNLPGTDGREFLAEIKREPDLKNIPVVVLTTSNDQGDIDACYSAGANSRVNAELALQEKERMRGVLEMAGAVCHELNQPLQAIFGYAHKMSHAGPEEQSREDLLGNMNRQIARIR